MGLADWILALACSWIGVLDEVISECQFQCINSCQDGKMYVSNVLLSGMCVSVVQVYPLKIAHSRCHGAKPASEPRSKQGYSTPEIKNTTTHSNSLIWKPSPTSDTRHSISFWCLLWYSIYISHGIPKDSDHSPQGGIRIPNGTNLKPDSSSSKA